MHSVMRRLRETWLAGSANPTRVIILLRLGWLIMVALVLALYLPSMAGYFTYLHQPATRVSPSDLRLTSEGARELQQLGLSVDFYAGYQVAVHFLFVLVFTAIGGLLLLRVSGDRIAIYAAFTLPMFAFGFWYPYEGINSHLLDLAARTLSFLGSLAFDAFGYVFPDGRFVPPWTRWAMIGWVINEANTSFYPPLLQQEPFYTPLNLLTAVMLVTVLAAQVYRFRKVSTPVQQHQTKWVLFGLVVAAVGFGGITTIVSLTDFRAIMPGTLTYFLAFTGLFLSPLAIPVSIMVAILRSGLWDVDVIINRTLVYGSLTGALALAYWAAIVTSQAILRPIAGEGNDLAVVLSTLFIAALFLPLRRVIQAFIDRRFYRRKYDATETLASFSATLRDEVDLDKLRGELLAVVNETMQPAHVSVWLKQTTRR